MGGVTDAEIDAVLGITTRERSEMGAMLGWVRRRAGLSQREYAAAAGIPVKSVVLRETGGVKISDEILAEYASGAGMPLIPWVARTTREYLRAREDAARRIRKAFGAPKSA